MACARMLRLGALALALLVLGVGCRRSTVLHPVNGKVIYHGALLTNGVVVFTPDATRGESGPIAVGTIHADGSYTLNTGDATGAGAGWYRVTVAGFTTPVPKSATPAQPQMPLPVLPDKYRDPELSLLRCQVKADQPNNIDLHLD
jgi:hypothetical protein